MMSSLLRNLRSPSFSKVSLIQRISLFILYAQCIIFAVHHHPGTQGSGSGSSVSSPSFLVQSTTNVKWTANQDPNAPLAAKVPRSQKYWDDNNIERPDYAKTDAEIAAERKKGGGAGSASGSDSATGGGNSNGTNYTKLVLRIVIGAIFFCLWTGIYQFGMMGKKGTRLGSSSGSSSASSNSNTLLNYSARMKNSFGGGNTVSYAESLEEKARKARLARFESQFNDKNKEE